MSHYKPYPKYKDSGVEWIGEVPESWSLLRLANAGNLVKANGGNKQDDSDEGVPCIRYGDLYTTYDLLIRNIEKFINPEVEADYTTIKYGDILFAASGETFEEIGKSAVNLNETHACCGGDVVILRPKKNINPVFLGYAAGSSSAQAQKTLMGKGFTVIHIYGDQLRNLVIAAPSEHEQQLIGAEIDRETASIDAIIAKKTRFIELLKEKRSALIIHAVTKGLNPNVKMKDSGVEWIGEVPEHWRVCQLKHLGRLKGGAGFPPDLQGISGNEIAFYKVSDLAKSEDGINLGDTENTLTEAQTRALGANIFDTGTLAWAKIGAALSLNRRRVVSRRCCLDNNMTGFIVDRLVASVIYSFYLMTIVDFSIHAKPGAVPSFSEGDQGELKVPCPPLNEQELIAQAIEIGTTRIDLLTQKTQHSIDLLKERRSALITAAVTGQIDLRESA